MNAYPITVKPFGEHAILIEWPNEVKESILDDILQFDHYLKEHCLEREKWETVSAYNSLTLIQKENSIEYEKFSKQIQQWYAKKEDAIEVQRFLWKFPVCYDLDFGIDLEQISKQLNMGMDEIISLHTNNSYTVYGIGFLPGFMYLGGLPKELEVPRRAAPRLKVEKGAVGLAGKQTGIYPQQSPGGWNIIGNCPIPIFNSDKEEPCMVRVGDKVQFYQISRAEYDLHKIEGEVGIYEMEKISINA